MPAVRVRIVMETVVALERAVVDSHTNKVRAFKKRLLADVAEYLFHVSPPSWCVDSKTEEIMFGDIRQKIVLGSVPAVRVIFMEV